MCEPVSLTALATMATTVTSAAAAITPGALAAGSAALGIGSSLLQYSAQQDTAKAQTIRHEANQQRSLQSYTFENTTLQQRAIEEQNSSSQRASLLQSEAISTTAREQNRQASLGLTGLSVDGLLSDLAGQEESRQDSVNQNLRATLNSLQDRRSETGATLVSRQGQTTRGQAPSGLALGINIGSNILGGYNTYNTATLAQQRASR